MAGDDTRPDKFPAPSKQAVGTISGETTTASSMYFSDKIVVTLTQGGRLAQWIQVPLTAPPTTIDTALAPAIGSSSSTRGLLPSTYLTPTTLLGAGSEARDTLGHLYAAEVASSLVRRDPADRRTLLLGLGLVATEVTPDSLFDFLELVGQVL